MTVTSKRTNALSLTASLLIFSGIGCKNSVQTIQTTRSGSVETPFPEGADSPSDSPDAVDVPDAIEAKTYLQSRSVVTVKLSQDFVGGSGKFSFFNASTETVLIQDESLSLSPNQPTDGFDLVSQNYDIFLRIYPEEGSLSGRFRYGENRLKATIDSRRTSSTSVWLRDFNIQSVGVTSFASGDQKVAGFQGWVSPLNQATVSKGSKLTTSFGQIVNQ